MTDARMLLDKGIDKASPDRMLVLRTQKAHAKALAELERCLENDVDDAPCPRCGWVQAHMLEAARRRRKQRTDYIQLLSVFATVCPVFGVLFFRDLRNDFPPNVWETVMLSFVGIFVIALPILIWRTISERRWNPNNSPIERRLAIAAETSIKREDYLKMVEHEQTGIQVREDYRNMLQRERRQP